MSKLIKILRFYVSCFVNGLLVIFGEIVARVSKQKKTDPINRRQISKHNLLTLKFFHVHISSTIPGPASSEGKRLPLNLLLQ